MIGTLIVTHGKVAEALLETVERIMGNCNGVSYFAVDWDADLEEAKKGLGKKLEHFQYNDGVLILTDMFGGTPTNLSLSYYIPNKIEVVTGVNLPMVIKAMLLSSGNVSEAAKKLKVEAQKSIHIANELL